MGGSIALTVRTDEKIYRVKAWTNCLSDLLKSTAILDNDSTAIVKYCEQCLSEGKNYNTSPYSYGLVFVDFINRNFFTCNNYCRFDYFDPYELRNLTSRRLAFKSFLERERISTWNYHPGVTAKAKQLRIKSTLREVEHAADNFIFMIDWKPWNVITFSNLEGMKEAMELAGWEFTETEEKDWAAVISIIE